MYAKVKFLQDGKVSIVQTAVVKNFQPANVADFERRTTYKVFWDGDENTRGGYYDAEIIKLADTKETLSEPSARRERAAEPAAKRSSSLQKSGTLTKKKQKKVRGIVKSQVEKELLQHLGDSEEEEEEENLEVLRLKAKLDKRAAKIRRLKAKNECLCKLNHELQLALCAKVLEKALTEQVPGVAVAAAVQAGISVPIGAPLRLVSAPLRPALVAAAANGAPPRPVPAPVAAAASGVAGLPVGDAGGPDFPLLAEEDSFAKNEIVDHTFGLQNEDGMIHAGQGIYINPESWEEMQKAENDSMFCKITASSIWPVPVLLERSVTGIISNKARAAGQEKAFAPLTPHKVQALSGCFWLYLREKGYRQAERAARHQKMRRYLSEKLSDLRRNR